MEVNSIWTYIDQLFVKQLSVPGRYGEKALDCARCDVSITDVSYEGSAENCVRQSSELSTFFSGDFRGVCPIGDSDTNIGRALERCLQSMYPEEVSIVIFCVRKDYDDFNPEGITLGSIRCQVTLNSLVNDRLIFEREGDEKYQMALENKARGVILFNDGRTVDAFLRFNRAIKFLVSMDLGEDDLPQACVTELTILLYNNMASCHLKQGNFAHAVTLCSKILAVQPANVKALFRRGVARAELAEYNEAKVDFEQVLLLEPSNSAVVAKLAQLKHKVLEINTNYANVVKKMFETHC